MAQRKLVILLTLGLTHCDPVAMAPPKTHTRSTAALSVEAKEGFWDAFHAGDYDAIDPVLGQLTAAYLKAPSDAELALLTAHAHLWRLSERSRLNQVPARITDHAALAVHYFSQAERMRPDDRRIGGWLGGSLAALGGINEDDRLRRQGYFTLKDAAASYPEFNYFTFSYSLSRLARTHERWPEAVKAMWTSVDVCAQAEVSRSTPNYQSYASAEIEARDVQGDRRVCWNSSIAPHNFEGFFLQSGDVLVKNGQPREAVVMYMNAKLSPSYGAWPYRDVLEARIRSAPERARQFDRGEEGVMMISSAYSCTGCHQK